ncbi:MAG: thermonuclease family protein, partial [Nanoarchaeota archaeon]|nr:thermonuclease family protein [Nanoarchaeota archaeon]
NTEKPQPIPKQNMTLFKVISITDGDTIKVNINGKTEIVRLLGIDSPELDKKECFSKEAKLEMSKFTKNKSVKLEKDLIQPDRDRYKRLLRYIYLENGVLINEEMVKNGYAIANRKYNSDKLQKLISLENYAKTNKLGLWNFCKTI